jgi:acyl-coenzyme A synthetase/AMP-(fatty) acid ligase
VLETLVYFKVPGYVHFCEELPLTASGKPRRADIKALAQQALSNGECIDTRSLKKRKRVNAS